jgi:hypothetical protein
MIEKRAVKESAADAGGVARASRGVLRWVSLYTRGLPAETASDRMAEIESDLHEHATLRCSTGGTASLPAEIRSRAFRGAMSDLLWRDGEMRSFRAARLSTMTRRERGTTRLLSWVLLLAAALVSAGGLVASVRAATNISIYGGAGLGIPIFVTAVLAVLSLGLIRFTASRAAGVLLLIVASGFMNWNLLAASTNLSARGTALMARIFTGVPLPVTFVALLMPSLLLAVALVLVLRALHRIEQRPA